MPNAAHNKAGNASSSSTSADRKKRLFDSGTKGVVLKKPKLTYSWTPSWTSDTVIVSSGNPSIECTVHASVLKAPFFKTALDGPWREAGTRKISLDDVDPEQFNAYMTWAYSGMIVYKNLSINSEQYWLHYCKSYVFGDYVQDTDYCEHVVKQMLYLGEDHSSGLPSPKCILWIYNRTVDGSPLRRLLRDVCVTGWHASRNMGSYSFNDYPHEFLADMTSQTLSLLYNISKPQVLNLSDYLK